MAANSIDTNGNGAVNTDEYFDSECKTCAVKTAVERILIHVETR